MLLDEERYASVVAYGRDAVSKFNEKRMEEGFALAEQGWKAFPESGAKWNQGYNYAKSFFKHAMENRDMVIAKCWLDRMIENNDELHLYDFEIEHMKAKYEFEVGNLDEAFELWKNLLKQKGVGYRYFQSDDPKYKEFYKSRK
ncbi:hypothetical protein [Treponema putidum]|uniref:Uncharacterized protein n=1 Tax=Treponema putidum TaxID=221027 RepID=A0AAE9SKY6_9SPIR|nr:hypothetical protein [Treponema putidum]AIN93636.1 hypothetical protein JO40_05505 [Treponema putidum]TWI77722.1 hypothetical protein JM98_01030 [Treponema putidum]UTY29883.1 hypothetical protein E4N76_13595 [Treponema putidum]UTY32336.1 hypothetical protein E4N75_13360 [Treponema putidum]UTY34742.1 hypothetical protein E4N74_12560 [Treponema putidum]